MSAAPGRPEQARTAAQQGEGAPVTAAQADQGLVIIGAGLAGWTTAREFRKLDPTTPVLLITADSGDFYAKPSLSNAFMQGRAPAQLVTTPAATMAAKLNVTLHARTRVMSIDPLTRTVATSAGHFKYQRLVLATGAQAIRVPLAGNAAEQVLSVNSLDDFGVLYAQVTGSAAEPGPTSPAPMAKPTRRVLIMGAGLIGCEFANDLAAAGWQVSVADPATSPMAALLPPGASAELRAALSELGVAWHFGATVTAVNHAPHATAHQRQSALQVALSNGESVPADVVLSAIGLRADTALAQAAGLRCERGIVVDRWLQTSAPNIFALGDGAQYASAADRTLPFVMPIMSAAKTLAATLCGSPTELVFPLMPVAIKTPALPVVVAPPPPGTAGAWQAVEPGLWHFLDPDGQPSGFVLTGKQTARRGEQGKLLER